MGPRTRVRSSYSFVSTWHWKQTNLLLRTRMASIKKLHLVKQTKPKPILRMADHRIYCRHSKGLTSWVPLGPRWLAHRWLFVSACPQNMRPPHSTLSSYWRMTLMCPLYTDPRDQFASGTQCKDAHCSCAPLAKRCCWGSGFHLQKWTMITV